MPKLQHMKPRIIFVGIHNKENLPPLDSSTRSGKLIDSIIAVMPKSFECIKTNLFNSTSIPSKDSLDSMCDEWHWTYLPTCDDIIVLLGNDVRKHFKHLYLNTIFLKHPACIWSNANKAKYIENVVKLITD